jgi:acetyl-CoA carboxylase biotin carboxyl carrier protein
LRQGDASAGPISVAIDRGQDNEAGGGTLVPATLPGTFLTQHPSSSSPLVPLGGRVRAGDIVGLVQVGSIYAPVIAPVDGSLDRILAAPETLVGFGTPLFEIRLSEKAA